MNKLGQSKAFSSFSVGNLEKAGKFYSNVLGLKVTTGPMDALLELHIEGQNNILIYEKANHEPATYTILNFLVSDIDEAADSLLDAGVVFEHYEGDIATDEKGISRSTGQEPNIAWFKDPAGNILSIIEE